MSKSAKNRAKLERLKNKRSKRAANAAKYSSLAGSDKNKKRKFGVSGGDRTNAKHQHLVTSCGNLACKRCSLIAIKSLVALRAKTHGKFAAAKLEKRLLNRY